MKIEFKYCGLICRLDLEEADDIEVNPVPIMTALVQLVNAISYYRSFELVLTSRED